MCLSIHHPTYFPTTHTPSPTLYLPGVVKPLLQDLINVLLSFSVHFHLLPQLVELVTRIPPHLLHSLLHLSPRQLKLQGRGEVQGARYGGEWRMCLLCGEIRGFVLY